MVLYMSPVNGLPSHRDLMSPHSTLYYLTCSSFHCNFFPFQYSFSSFLGNRGRKGSILLFLICTLKLLIAGRTHKRGSFNSFRSVYWYASPKSSLFFSLGYYFYNVHALIYVILNSCIVDFSNNSNTNNLIYANPWSHLKDRINYV